MTKEDTAEVDDEKDVLEEVFRGGVCHLEELLKGYWHGLDLKKGYFDEELNVSEYIFASCDVA